MAKYMPQVVGVWLAGSYDVDRSVSKAAQDALQQVFPSQEKMASLRKAYQKPILEFCRNVIDKETPQTLSDERAVSPDEMEAKYSRVLAAVLSLIASLMRELSSEDIEKHEATYTDLIQDENLWKLAYYADPAVRRAVHRLLRICFSKQPETSRSALTPIGSAYLHHALRSDQTGTSLDFIECLVALVRFDPTAWTANVKGAKGLNRLCNFLKKGSQLGPQEFWSNVSNLLESVPQESFAGTEQDSSEILKAMHTGIDKKEEPRPNLTSAYRSYIHVAGLMAESLPLDDSRRMLQTNLMPILRHYVRPSAESSDWGLPEANSQSLINQLLEIPTMDLIVAETWPELTRKLTEDMKVSLPEQAKDFEASQSAVAKQGSRWAFAQATLLRKQEQNSDSTIRPLTDDVVNAALGVLRNRNAKPYGAAALVESILYEVPLGPETEERVQDFVRERLPELMSSPSATYLAGMLYHASSNPDFNRIWEATLKNVLSQEDALVRERGLRALLTSPRLPNDMNLASSSPALQAFLLQQTKEALEGQHDWSFITNMPKQSSESISNSTTDDMLADMTNSLSLDETAPHALEGLQILTKMHRGLVEQFMRKPEASLLLPRLLYLSESADEETSRAAATLNNLIQSNLSLSQMNGDDSSQDTLFRTIQSGLLDASEMSVSVDTLLQIARDFHQRNEADNSGAVLRLLPSTSAWEEALSPFTSIAPLPSLSITSILKGAVHLVKSEGADVARSAAMKLSRDADGSSVAIRIAKYMTGLPRSIYSLLPTEQKMIVLRLLALTRILANHNISIAGANHMWSDYSPESETEMAELVSSLQRLLTEWLQECPDWWDSSNTTAPSAIKPVMNALLESSKSNHAVSFYSAETYCTLGSELLELHGLQRGFMEHTEQRLMALRKDKHILSVVATCVAYPAGLSSSKLVTRYCNELVSDLTTVDINSKPEEVLQKFILLNSVHQALEGIGSVATQRVIFLVKHALPWFTLDITSAAKAEAFTAFAYLLPAMREIYGEHWEQVLTAITTTWSAAPELVPSSLEHQSSLPVLHASLRLFDGLRRMTADADANDDLVDSWKDAQGPASTALLHMLQSSSNCPDEFNQPLRVVNDLANRCLSRLSSTDLGNLGEVYTLLSAPSQSIQQAAYDLVLQKIPPLQEQISLDAALNKTDAQLPEELISLVLEAPTTKDLDDTVWDRGIPLPLRGYLLSWLLLFNHFEHAVSEPLYTI